MLRAGELVIDESNAHIFCDDDFSINGEKKSRGKKPRDWAVHPFGGGPFRGPSQVKIIPEDQWPDLISKKVADKSQTSDILLASGMPPLDQNGTNYCWGNGPTNCVRIIRQIANQPFVDLSPASVCARVVGYRNEGGYGPKALDHIVKYGIVPASLWPANAINPKYDNAETQAARKAFVVTEWDDISPRNFALLATYCLLNIPVAVGYNWWSHEVTAVDLVMISAGVYGIRIWNSWGRDFGQNGFAVLNRSKATPDDCCAPRVSMAA